jgi:hypothetical protein
LLLLLFFFFGFNNLVSFPWPGFVFCAVGDDARGRGIRLSRKFGHLLCCGLCFLFFSICFFVSCVDVFVWVVKMYAVRECDRDGEWHVFWGFSIHQCWDSLCCGLF